MRATSRIVVSCAVVASSIAAPGARAAGRVDLYDPVFTNPTAVTNPLFPVTALSQAVHLGYDEDEALRTETTLLPATKTIAWLNTQIEARVVQFVGYLDGQIAEVALDFFAQADDGSVWYLGEDVFNYEDGVVVDNEGTWLAGADGPGGMIMPADPQVGDVFRPENIPGLVFEEVTVLSTDQTFDGPTGPVPNSILVREDFEDGSHEYKVFAPGYGEAQADVPGEELYHAALGIPTDALSGAVPTELQMIEDGAEAIFDSAIPGIVTGLSPAPEDLVAAWETYRSSTPVPALLEAQMDDALERLVDATDALDIVETMHASNDVTQACLDIMSRYASNVPTDIVRLGRWARQVQADHLEIDGGAVLSHVVSLGAIWSRVSHTVPSEDVAAAFEASLAELRSAAESPAWPVLVRSAAQTVRDQIKVLEDSY